MNAPLAVQEFQRLEHLADDAADQVRRQGAFRGLGGQVALHQLHDHPAALLVDAVDVHDVVVLEIGQELGLFAKLHESARILTVALIQLLDGHVSLERIVACAIDGGHLAPANDVQEFVIRVAVHEVRSSGAEEAAAQILRGIHPGVRLA